MIVTEWRNLISEWYTDSRAGVKFNGVRWQKYIIKKMLEFGHDMWTERCTIVHAATNVSHENRLRAQAWRRCLELKRDSWKLPANSRDLTHRDKKFFTRSPILQIEIWNSRVDIALTYVEQISDACDIRQYGTVDETVRHARRPRQVQRRNNNDENADVGQEGEDIRPSVQRSLLNYFQSG